jgi:hypothetical protein
MTNSRDTRLQVVFVRRWNTGKWAAEYDKSDAIVMEVAEEGLRRLKERDEGSE